MSKGRIIAGRYRVTQRLGRGNFGVVWEAEELLSGESVGKVAIKVFTAEVDRREIALLAGLSHPSILAYRAVVEDDDEVCLVTELADGGDAAGKLKAWPDGIPPNEVRQIVHAVADALRHLHGQGWVHRDVKPANILFVKGTPKLGDVGTARALTSTTKATSTASLAYTAPEFFAGKTTPSVDVYALGCATFELLTGRLPFDGNMSEIVHKHLTADVEFPADMPADLKALIQGCTVKAPERRWTIDRVMDCLAPANTPAPATSEAKPAQNVPPAANQQSLVEGARERLRERRHAVAPAAPGPQQAAPTKQAPAAAPAAVGGPTPLDTALQRHLRLHGARWGDAETWRTFMETASPAAAAHNLSERALIRRAGELWPEVQTAALSEMEKISQIGAWVMGLRGRRWTAPDWADLLDRLNTADDATMAAHRDALLLRLYPTAPGATRTLNLGGGLLHVLVYRPTTQLNRPVANMFDALMATNGVPSTLQGVWCSAEPLTLREWSAITGQLVPAGLAPQSTAVGNRVVADAVLATLRRRFPTDELRWPTLTEYDGMKKIRTKATEAALRQVAATPGASQAKARAALVQMLKPTPKPKSLGAAVVQAFGKVAVDMVKEFGEAWLTDPPSAQATNGTAQLQLNIVSPVPKVSE